MQQWLNDKKNMPIIIGLLAVILALAVGVVLFSTGVIGGQAQDTVSSTPSGPGQVEPGPGMPPPGGPSTMTGAPGIPGASPIPGAQGSPVETPPGGTPGKPAAVAVAALPVAARPDPFAPYIDLRKLLARLRAYKPAKERVEALVQPLRITNFTAPNHQVLVQQPINSVGNVTGTTSTASIGRVSGVMLANGAFAIVENNGQSSVLQPGDELPSGGGRIVSIQTDSITVKQGDSIVKVPISAGQDNSGNGLNNVPMNPDQAGG